MVPVSVVEVCLSAYQGLGIAHGGLSTIVHEPNLFAEVVPKNVDGVVLEKLILKLKDLLGHVVWNLSILVAPGTVESVDMLRLIHKKILKASITILPELQMLYIVVAGILDIHSY